MINPFFFLFFLNGVPSQCECSFLPQKVKEREESERERRGSVMWGSFVLSNSSNSFAQVSACHCLKAPRTCTCAGGQRKNPLSLTSAHVNSFSRLLAYCIGSQFKTDIWIRNSVKRGHCPEVLGRRRPKLWREENVVDKTQL